MDLNSLSAKIIKAEMLGDDDRVLELKSQLEELKKKQAEEPGIIGNHNRRQHGNHNHDRNDNRRNHNQRHGNRQDTGHQMSKEELSKLNALNAKILKAEMMGDDDRLADLRSQLDELKNGKKGLDRESFQSNKFDHGLDEPMNRKEPLAKSSKVVQLARKISDDRLSLNQMFVRAKQGDVDEEAKLYLASSSKLLNVDDEYEETIRRKKRKKIEKEEYEVIKDDEDDEECQWCITKLKKHLIVCIKQSVYLCLPTQEPLVPNHCYIRSRSHVKCSVQADEICHREILNLRSRICDMLESDKRNCIFMEIYFRKSKHHHFQIECLPIKQKYFADAKMYFRKAILECETEWSDNKKLIEIKDKPITSAIPKGLSYFWVSFGPSNDGYGHVIEDERYFPRHFGHEVVAGLLDIDRYKYMKPRNETFDQQYDRGSKFKSSWKKFDTTEDEVIHEEIS